MEMRAIEQAIRQLVTVGRCPSVRTVRDITGGSQRDVSKCPVSQLMLRLCGLQPLELGICEGLLTGLDLG